MKKYLLLILLIVIVTNAWAQNMIYTRQVIDTLTSARFWGRGYTKEGMKLAADYIASQLNEAGVKPLCNKSYFQNFHYPVNTFPGAMQVNINNQELRPGIDFIIGSNSKGIVLKGLFEKIDKRQFLGGIVQSKLLVMYGEEKLTASVANQQDDYTILFLKKNSITSEPKIFNINIEQKFEKNFTASNVCGIVKGTAKPDSIVVFTAHYDHLGGMGNSTYFPGANDNASGISMLLNLAKHYAANPQPYSVAFIAFAGEEAGLIGSKYFVENPLIPLTSIRFLINVDLVGTGEEGITVVNASEFEKEFSLLKNINDEKKLLPAINARGKAANSDHYWFTEKGVPAFFLYTLGGIKAYHDVDDKASTLPLTAYENLFKLLINFNENLYHKKD